MPELLSQFAIDETRDVLAEVENSEQLEEFRQRRFSSMEDEIRQVFEVDDPPLRFVPLVWRVCKDGAPQYVMDPRRAFGGTAADIGKLETIYRDSRMNAFLRLISERLVAQTVQIVAVEPLGPLRVRRTAFSRYEAAVQFEHALDTDIRDAKRVELRVPIKTEVGPNTSMVTYGKRVYTRDEAWTEAPGGDAAERSPIFGDSVKHDFGYVPLAVAALEPPQPGFWWPGVAEDLLALQIGVNIWFSDLLDIMMYQCWDREALIGEGAKAAVQQSMHGGPRSIRAFEGDGNDLRHVVTSPNPKAEKYLKAIETLIRVWSANAYVSDQSLLHSTGITGDAKAEERLDQETHRRRMENVMRDFERDLVRLVADVQNHRGSGSLLKLAPPQLETLDFHYVEPRNNTLQDAQAAGLNYALGRDSAIEDVMRRDGVGRKEAESRVFERLDELAEIVRRRGGAAEEPVAEVVATRAEEVPGIDRLDNNVAV